jgi:hypothetical protein
MEIIYSTHESKILRGGTIATINQLVRKGRKQPKRKHALL